MADSLPRQTERQCEHSDVRYFAGEKGAVACMICGRLFGHLLGDTFVAHNTSGKGPGPNTGASSEDQGEAVGSADNGAPSWDAASPAELTTGQINIPDCIYCGADCDVEDPEHEHDCPSVTGVFPITEQDFGPKCVHCGKGAFGGMCCVDCGAELKLGDHYMHREVDPGDPLLPGIEGASVHEVICVGCAATEALRDG